VARSAAKAPRAALRSYPSTAVRQWNRSWSTNEPQTREQWIAVIQHLLNEDRHDDAVQALAEFKKRFPDDELPPDLRDLK
jgi:TolA-binding protein